MENIKKIKKITKEALEMDLQTYKKVKGSLDPKEQIKISGDKPEPSMVSEYDAVIQPMDSETLKYLSNVKDKHTGEISKPFTISDKNYQIVRAITPKKEIVIGVMCHDEIDDNGVNRIHPIEYFEENIVKSIITPKNKQNDENYEGYRHYLVNRNTNEVRKFKTIKELVSINKGVDEDYMGVREFKKHMNERMFGKKKKIVEDEINGIQEKPDVTRLIDQMINKVKPYVDKLNEPLEKIQFITKLTNMLGLDANKLPTLINNLKKTNNTTFNTNQQQPVSENIIIKKKNIS